MEEWRSKWFLERRWQKCDTDELIKAMGDINDHVRLAAVSACSKAAELRQTKKEEHHLGKLQIINKRIDCVSSVVIYSGPSLTLNLLSTV